MYIGPEDIPTPVSNVEVIAEGAGIREIRRLRKQYGKGRWRKLKGIARARLPNGKIHEVELHWYEAHGIGKKNSRSRGVLHRSRRRAGRNGFVICIRNDGYEVSLEKGKVYPRLRDKQAEGDGLIRVVDESGEDYLYPAEAFLPISLSHAVEKALRPAS